jgi:hypothetical protein
MNVEYKYYEKNQNLEEVQAQIFNEAMKKYGGNTATAEQIRNRLSIEGFDNKSVRYAFTQDKKPLAYIQTRVDTQNKRTFIGYPWALSDCPQDVQEKMFDEMLAYLKQRDPEHKIVLGNVQGNWTEVHDFAKNKYKAKVDNEFKTYALEVSKMVTLENSGYSTRIATIDDEKILAELANSEPGFGSAFANDEALQNFFKDQLANHEVLLVYKGEKLVSAGALNSFEPDNNGRVNIRFTATRDYNFDYWKAFVVELSKYLDKKGLRNTSFTIFDRQPEHLKFYDHYGKVASISVLYEIPK